MEKNNNSNQSQNKLALMVVTYVLVFAVGGACGYYINSTTKATNNLANRGGQFGQMGQRNDFDGNFGGRGMMGGRVAGTITAINGNTITIKNSFSGDTETVTVTDSTTYKKTATTTKDSLTVGATISVTGSSSSSDSTTAATAITVQ